MDGGDQSPGVVEQRLAAARELEALGRRDEAIRAYLEVLSDDVANYDAMIRLGVLYVHAGNLPHAHVVFAEAVKRHGERSTPHAYLANVLLDLGDTDGATAAYEAAIRADPHDRIAHRGLAIVYERAGRTAAADAAWRAGFPDGALAVAAFRGAAEPVHVLLVTAAVGGNIPLYDILDDRVFAVTTLIAESYGDDMVLPRGGVIVNTIGDADRCARALDRAERALARTDASIINPPAQVRASGRAANAARFGALEGIVAPRVATFARKDLEASDGPQRLADHGFGFPLLLRSPGYQTGLHFSRVEAPAQLAQTVAELPGEQLLAMEYVDTRSADGMYRKYRVMFVDGRLYPLHLAIAHQWKVHYFSAAMADDDAYRDEERAFLTDPRGTLGQTAWSALERVRTTLDLDYGGVDFAIGGDGRLVVFEANATMVILPPDAEECWSYRREPIAAVRSAVAAMIARRAAVPRPAAGP
jgi:tetratricopeptide (TPR) repeat protein